MHRVLALVAFVAIVTAMAMYSLLGFPTDDRYQRAARSWAILVSSFALLAFMLWMRLPPGSPVYGFIQKFLVGMVVTWVFLGAWA